MQRSDDELEAIGYAISDPLRPGVACSLASCCRELWAVLQQPLAKLKKEHTPARALAAKVGMSCAELSEAKELMWHGKGLSVADARTLGMLLAERALPRVERLFLYGDLLGEEGIAALCAELDCGVAPRLALLDLSDTGMGERGAFALAAALSRGALPKLNHLNVGMNELGDAGLAALATPLRRRPALKALFLYYCGVGDDGVAALAANLQEGELKALEALHLWNNPFGDAACATLVAALGGPMLALTHVTLHNHEASEEAHQAVDNAVRSNVVRSAREPRQRGTRSRRS